MDQTTILALSVAGVLTPWLTEVLKILFGDLSGKKALTFSMVVSVAVAAGVLWYQHRLVFSDPVQVFASAGLVLGIATAVYQYIQKAVEAPANKVRSMMGK